MIEGCWMDELSADRDLNQSQGGEVRAEGERTVGASSELFGGRPQRVGHRIASLPSVKASVDSQIAELADDFLDHITRGKQPSVSEYTRRYPQIASLIPEVVAALQMMNQE